MVGLRFAELRKWVGRNVPRGHRNIGVVMATMPIPMSIFVESAYPSPMRIETPTVGDAAKDQGN